MVQPDSLGRLREQFEITRCELSFMTVDNAPLPGYVERDQNQRVERVAHDRYGRVRRSPERDVGFYMLRNTPLIRTALGSITDANIKREYGIHELVEVLALQGSRVMTTKIPSDECWTVNNASDLFWLATGLYRDATISVDIKKAYDSFQRDYGTTFDYEWFSNSRHFLLNIFDPLGRQDRPDVPLHFVTEFGM